MVLVRGTAGIVQLDPSSVIVMEIFHHAIMMIVLNPLTLVAEEGLYLLFF